MPTRGSTPSREHSTCWIITSILTVLISAGGCAQPRLPGPGSRLPRLGDEVMVCGELFHTGTRVVLFTDPGGYDAYRPHRFFDPEHIAPSQKKDRLPRFGSFRRNLPEAHLEAVTRRGWSRAELNDCVSQVVVHYDVTGTSQRCFEVLHDIRGLSCHFLLDLDGTIYQTLDLKERAWHAGVANDASIGIEIAHPGARGSLAELDKHYEQGNGRLRYKINPDHRGHLPPNFVAVPARSGVFEETIHGAQYFQYDFTEAQYRALEKLLVALARIFPGIEPRVPLDTAGQPIWQQLPDGGKHFRGVIGHHHITTAKQDPGPAFDWLRIQRALSRSRRSR